MRALLTVLLLVSATQLAGAPERLKIGFIGVLSGPLASLGDELLDGFRLRLGEKSNLGGVSVDLIVADDQAKPDVGVQDVTKMLDRDGAQIILVGTLSNVMLAIAPKVSRARRSSSVFCRVPRGSPARSAALITTIFHLRMTDFPKRWASILPTKG